MVMYRKDPERKRTTSGGGLLTETSTEDRKTVKKWEWGDSGRGLGQASK